MMSCSVLEFQTQHVIVGDGCLDKFHLCSSENNTYRPGNG